MARACEYHRVDLSINPIKTGQTFIISVDLKDFSWDRWSENPWNSVKIYTWDDLRGRTLFEFPYGTKLDDGSIQFYLNGYASHDDPRKTNLIGICDDGNRYRITCRMKWAEGGNSVNYGMRFNYSDGSSSHHLVNGSSEYQHIDVVSLAGKTVQGFGTVYSYPSGVTANMQVIMSEFMLSRFVG